MKHKNHRAEPYFTLLKNGQKTIEGRLRKGKYTKIKPGDYIEVYNPEETAKIDVKVKRVARYSSFRELLTQEPVRMLLPNVKTLDQAINVYRSFYTSQQEKQFGVVSIEVEKI